MDQTIVGAARSQKAVEGQVCTGRITRATLLTILLPLSFAALFGALLAAASLSPSGYDWRREVISKLTSPADNPGGYWLAAGGVMAAMLLAYPFSNYVAAHLQGSGPRFARWARGFFKWSFILVILSIIAQLVDPLIGFRKLHTWLVQVGGVLFAFGMVVCASCALRDRFHGIKGRKLLPRRLALYWGVLTFVPVAFLATMASLVMLAYVGQGWAENFRQSFRHTPMWHLAFWEWIGAGVVFAFLMGSALLLPIVPSEAGRTSR